MTSEKVLYHAFDLADPGYYIPVIDVDGRHAWLQVTQDEATDGPYMRFNADGKMDSKGF